MGLCIHLDSAGLNDHRWLEPEVAIIPCSRSLLKPEAYVPVNAKRIPSAIMQAFR